MYPYFIPISNVDGLRYINELEGYVTRVILPYYSLLDYDPDYLNNLLRSYNVKWILSSIMPDELLLKENIHQDFRRLADRLDIRDIIVWDMPTYLEDYDVSIKNTEYSIEIIKWFSSKEKYNIIPLAKGAYPEHLRYSLESIIDLNFDVVAFHVSEYLSTRLSPYPYIPDKYLTPTGYMSQLIEIIREYPFKEILLIGIGSPKTLELVDYDDRFRYAGLSWYIDGLKRRAYTPDGIKDITFKYIECNCPACISIPPLYRRKDSLPGHNLYIMNAIAGEAEPPDTSIYDLIADYHEDILIISGLYVGKTDSKYLEALKLIESIKPRHLVFLGNIFYTRDDSQYNRWISFIDKLKEIVTSYKIIIHAVRGYEELRKREILRNIDVIYAGIEDPLINRFEENIESRYFEYLVKFYIPYKDKLWILKYSYNKPVKIYIYSRYRYEDTLSSEEILKALEDEKKLRNVDMVYADLTTYPILDDEKMVGVPGVWVEDLEVDSEIKPGAIYINEYGKPKLILNQQ